MFEFAVLQLIASPQLTAGRTLQGPANADPVALARSVLFLLQRPGGSRLVDSEPNRFERRDLK